MHAGIVFGHLLQTTDGSIVGNLTGSIIFRHTQVTAMVPIIQCPKCGHFPPSKRGPKGHPNPAYLGECFRKRRPAPPKS
jgi:muramoyltetrapeptide carboxypeptidase LdcA involved in peptidoglycan recycling